MHHLHARVRSIAIFITASILIPRIATAACCPGDMNGNGQVQANDIPTFVQVLLTSLGTPDELCAADVNTDGFRTGHDIQTFTARLLAAASCTGACCVGGGACQLRTQAECQSLSGCFQGLATLCSPDPCACPSGLCDLDGLCTNGCETNVNSNPPCTSFTNLGTISGDTGAGVLNQSGAGEAWYRVAITENSNQPLYLSATVVLQSHPTSDYDLYVYCVNCNGNLAGSSSAGIGQADVVHIRWNDDTPIGGEDDSGFIIIEVRWQTGGCDGYELTVTGNTVVATTNCDQ